MRAEMLGAFARGPGRPLSLPNGVGVLSDGRLVVADGGNDRVCLLDPDGTPRGAFGRNGFGRAHLREPVGVFVAPDDHVFVADWHNHRFVVLSPDLAYVAEVGHFGFDTECTPPLTGRLYALARNLAHKGLYQERHHGGGVGGRRPARELRQLLRGLARYATKPRTLVAVLADRTFVIHKPNGCAFAGDAVVFSEKTARRLTVYRSEPGYRAFEAAGRVAGPGDGTPFGRLYNLALDEEGHLYVCDESQGRIVVLDARRAFVRTIRGADSGYGRFASFACCPLGGGLLAVVGGRNLQILARDGFRALLTRDMGGELHGVARDGIYVADRSKERILVLRLTAERRFGGRTR